MNTKTLLISLNLVFGLTVGLLWLVVGQYHSASAAPVAPQANTITVDTLSDENDGSCSDGDCSLRDAIIIATSGDTIDFSVTGTINLTLGEIGIVNYWVIDNLTIKGPGRDNLTISGSHDGTFFIGKLTVNISGVTIANGVDSMQNSGTLSLSDCTFTNNVGSNGIKNNDGATLNVTNCIFLNNNSANGSGGGIANKTGAILNISNSTFTGNQASSWGGAIWNYRGITTIMNTTFSGNSAWHGGAILSQEGSLDVSDSTFTGNGAKNSGCAGGAIYNYFGSDVTLTNNTFSGHNIPACAGGRIYQYSGNMDVIDCTFSNNTASIGGAIANYQDDTMNVSNSTFINNSSQIGGAILNNTTTTVTVTKSTFLNNHAIGGDGGAISFDRGTLDVSGSTFSGNSASGAGAGMVIFSSEATVTFSNNAVYSNTAQWGGGIANAGTLNVINTTISENNASDTGGGIENEGILAITNSTIAGNSAIYSGGGILNEGTATLINTIIANSPSGGDCGWGAMAPDSTNNMDTDASCSPGFTHTTSPALNLGWMTWIYTLGANSVAIDAGTNTGCPPYDQLGQPRPKDGDGDGNPICDVGSYEVQPPGLTIFLPVVQKNY